MSEPHSPVVDGRSARRNRNRDLVLDAVLALFQEGHFSPTPETVAARSGVSLRSVYRYVSSRDELFQFAIERHLEKTADVWRPTPMRDGDFVARLDYFLEYRLRLYESVAATNRASRAYSLTSVDVREKLATARKILRRQTEAQFGQELNALSDSTRTATLAAIDALTQFEGLDSLVSLQGLSLGTVRTTLHTTLTTLLQPNPKGSK